MLEQHRWPDDAALRVRIGLHQGPIASAMSGLVGLAIHVAARVCAAAHGGQILVTDAIVASLGASSSGFEDFGWFRLRYVPEPCRLFAVRTGLNPLAAPRGLSPWRDDEKTPSVDASDPFALTDRVEHLMRDFYGPRSTEVVATLDAQWPTIEAAIAQLRDLGSSEALTRLIVSLSPYLVVAKGRTPLARELLRGVLAESEGDPGVELLFEVGRCLADTGDLYRASTVFEEMNEVAQATGDVCRLRTASPPSASWRSPAAISSKPNGSDEPPATSR